MQHIDSRLLHCLYLFNIHCNHINIKGFKKNEIVFYSIITVNYQSVIGVTVFIITEMIDETDNNRCICDVAAHFAPTAYSDLKTPSEIPLLDNVNGLRLWILMLFTWTTGNIITAQNKSGECEIGFHCLHR